MPKSRPAPQDPQPGEKTQVLGSEAIRRALEANSEPDAGMATTILPAGLPVREDLSPAPGEEATQPIPQVAADTDAEVRSIVEGPEATVAMKAGTPPLPQDWGATQVLPAGLHGEPPPLATQVLPIGAPQVPEAGATQVLHTGLPIAPQDGPPQSLPPDVRTIEIPSDQLPSAPRRGMPLWGWAGITAVLLGLAGGGLYFLRPDLLGLGNSESNQQDAPSEAMATQPREEAAPDPPPALRPYFEKAEKGDASAMRMLGVMYFNGLNVPRDEKEGMKWYRKAADAGSKAAQKELKLLEGRAPSK